MELNTIEKNLSYSLHILFKIQGKLFAISSESVSGITTMPKAVTKIPYAAPGIYGTCISHGNVVTVINTPYLLNLSDSVSQQLIILSSDTMKGLLIENVIAVEYSENLRKLEKPPFVSDLVKNYYLYTKTNTIAAELGVSDLLERCK